MSLRTKIGNIQHQIRGQLALHTKTPLVDISCGEVRIDPGRNHGWVSGECIRDVRPISGLKWPRGLPQSKRRIARKRCESVAYDLMVEESAEAGSNDGARPSQGTPRQTNTGTEIVFVSTP